MSLTIPLVAIDARYIQDHFPGIGRYTYHLIEALARIAPSERLAALYNPALSNTRYDLAALERFPNLKLIRVDVPTFSLKEQGMLGLGFKRSGLHFRAYHSPYYVMPYFTPLPTVVTLFDLIPLLFPEEVGAGGRLLFRFLAASAARAAAAVIAPSQATRADLVRVLRVPAGKIRVIPLSAACGFVPQTLSEVERVRAKYSLPPVYILYVGINKPHKNLELLLQAASMARGAPALVVAGAWDARYEKPAGAEQGNVRFIHAVPEGDLPALYAAAAAFVIPSLYEGFGLPALEAMACGVPVLAARGGSLPEVVGDAGLLFDPRDGQELAGLLERVLSDGALRQDLNARSLARAAQFSWERTAKETLEVYRDVARS